MAARREIKRFAVFAQVRAVIVVFGVDVGTERLSRAKITTRNTGRYVEVERTVFRILAGSKVQSQAVWRDESITFVSFGVNVAIQRLGHAPVTTGFVRDKDVAVVIVAVHQQLTVVVEQLR